MSEPTPTVSKELAASNPLGMQTVPQSFNEQMRFCELVSQAHGMLPKAYEGNPANVLVAIQYGAALGIEPMAALQNIDVIQGKPTLSAKAVAALVRKAGHKLYLDEDAKNMRVTATIIRNDDREHPFTATRDKTWATAMGLMGKDNYKKQPMTMLMWRAITACANKACPELFLGVGGAYTADELHDMDAGEPEVTVETVEEAADVDDWGEQHMARARKVSDLMKQAGVKTKEEAELILASLTGDTNVKNTKDVPDDDLATWLESGDQVLSTRITQTLQLIRDQHYAEQAQAEPVQEESKPDDGQ